MNKYDVLDKAKELGEAIINSDEYLNLKEAEKQFMNDPEASSLIETYEKKALDYKELRKESKGHSEKEKELLNTLKEIQQNMNNNKTLTHLYYCQKEYDSLIIKINDIIDYKTGNTIKGITKGGCTGCSGCD